MIFVGFRCYPIVLSVCRPSTFSNLKNISKKSLTFSPPKPNKANSVCKFSLYQRMPQCTTQIFGPKIAYTKLFVRYCIYRDINIHSLTLSLKLIEYHHIDRERERLHQLTEICSRINEVIFKTQSIIDIYTDVERKFWQNSALNL